MMGLRKIEEPAAFGNVGVLMGGASGEREISLKGGNAVLSALQSRDVNAVGVDVGDRPMEALGGQHFDRMFIVVHGRGGEDGMLQGLLDSLKIPYTGSGLLGSALAMDKLKTKLCWRGMEIPTPPWWVLKDDDDIGRCIEKLGFPVIVKPALEGSSLGMSKAGTVDELMDAWSQASGFGCEVFAEAWIEGKEYTVGILDDTALPVIGLKTPREFYDFEAKYCSTTTEYICPCGLDRRAEQDVQTIALRSAHVLGVEGWCRADLLIDSSGKPWFIEVNTVPGMTDHSLVPMAARAAGMDFEELVWRILETSVECESSKTV